MDKVQNSRLDLRSESPIELWTAPTLSARNSRRKPKVQTALSLDFFAGSGLVSEGLKPYFQTAWANDICEKKAAVYQANHNSTHFHLGSVGQVRGSDLPASALAWASFPCQDLSLAGLAAGIHGKRSGLVWEWLRVIDEMPQAPQVLVAENVLGLVATAGGDYYRSLHMALVHRGYQVGALLLDAARWVPQSRPRIFVVAVKARSQCLGDLASPRPTWAQHASVLHAAVGMPNWVNWCLPEPGARTQQLSDIVQWHAPYADAPWQAANLALIAPRHRELLDAAPRSRVLVAPGYKRTRSGRQVLELRFDNTAGCLRTPSGGSSRQILVFNRSGTLRSRLLTVRETARLMGAPDSYKIPGGYNDGYRAMGDAVAVPVVSWLAKHLLRPLVDYVR